MGHPRGLSTLFFTEMWERFSFYGMKAMLFLFITAAIVEGPQSGLGFGEEMGGAIAGLYNSFVYLMALPGGWLADRLIGQRRAVMWGGIIIALGHYSMAVPGVLEAFGIHSGKLFFFFQGLVLIVLGTGLLKPNISTMVGELYAGDTGARRDAGFSIFYMGINLGAFLAPILCGNIRQAWGWHFGFGLAGIGMTAGVLWYIMDGKNLGTAGLHPKSEPSERPRAARTALLNAVGVIALIVLATVLHRTGVLPLSWTGVAEGVGYATLIVVGIFLTKVAFFTGLSWPETKKVLVIAILFVFTALFWSGFEQASTSLNAFARDLTQRVFFGREIPTEWLQAVNPLFIIALAPLFGSMWVRLASKNLNPAIPTKFALGLLQLGLGFLVIMVAAQLASGIDGVDADPSKGVMPTWLCMMYLLFTTGELCLSPVGLSTITKLSPPKFVSQMMGIWFIAAALGNLIAGRVGGMIENLPPAAIFRTVALIVGGAGLLLLLFSPFIRKRMMAGVE